MREFICRKSSGRYGKTGSVISRFLTKPDAVMSNSEPMTARNRTIVSSSILSKNNVEVQRQTEDLILLNTKQIFLVDAYIG